MTLRWGLLSTAKINDRFLAGCADSDQMEVTAVASRDAERARRYAQEHGIRTSHGRYEALLEDPEVDAVYISLPNGLHLEWSQRALRAGKHVLCEKPMGRDPTAVAAAFDVAAEHERVLMEAFMYRHHPQTQRLTELVAQGAIGALRLVRATFSFPLRDKNDVRLSRALDGGALMDVGWHPPVDDELQRRLASNEAVFRQVNEGIQRGQWPGDEGQQIGFRCECARLGCNALLELTRDQYEHVRASPRRFIMLGGHERPEVETKPISSPRRQPRQPNVGARGRTRRTAGGPGSGRPASGSRHALRPRSRPGARQTGSSRPAVNGRDRSASSPRCPLRPGARWPARR
jgi:Oxidoreductase family, NAD-binding Rossmann fold